MALADADEPTHLRLLLHDQPVDLLELPRHRIDLTLVLWRLVLLLLLGDQLIAEVDIGVGLSVLELEGVAVVLVGVLNIEDAQPLLLVFSEQFVIVEEGEVDVAVVVVVVGEVVAASATVVVVCRSRRSRRGRSGCAHRSCCSGCSSRSCGGGHSGGSRRNTRSSQSWHS